MDGGSFATQRPWRPSSPSRRQWNHCALTRRTLIGDGMKLVELERMSADNLWKLRVEIGEALAVRLTAEKDVLEERLKQLAAKPRVATSERRPYPTVPPKFRNLHDPSQTWAGRGMQPRWLKAQLRSGKMVDQFRI